MGFMATTLTIRDESAGGEITHSFTLENLTERLTVRELLRARIHQEVQEYNARQRVEDNVVFQGLVQPSDAERFLNGFRQRRPKPVDPEKQFEKACEAFLANGFFVLINDRQAEKLDEEFVIEAETEVSFVKLVPLVGG